MGNVKYLSNVYAKIQISNFNEAGIYIHIPFCDDICDFCAFTKVKFNESQVEHYVTCLTGEISIFEQMNEIDLSISPKTLYFGGGTPSVLTAIQIRKILSCFNLKSIEELTIECHPNHLSSDYLKSLIDLGFNRISAGIENTNPERLAYIGRRRHSRDIYEISQTFSKCGFDNWSVDLMFGYENFGIAEFEKMLKSVCRLEFAPNHLSVYALTVEPGTLLAKDSKFSVQDDLVDFYESIECILGSSGYDWEEISNWHKPNFGSIHNRIYWT